MKYLLTIPLLTVSFFVLSQNAKVDSLRALVEDHRLQDSSLVNLLYELSYYYSFTEHDSTAICAREALTLSRKIGFRKGEAMALRMVGITYYFKADYPNALTNFRECLRIAEEINNLQIVAQAVNNIGVVYDYQGDYDRALEYYHRALKIRESMGDSLRIAISLNNIGIIYEYEKDYIKALSYHKKSLDIRQRLNDTEGIASSLGNIANNYTYLGKYDTAITCYKQSTEIFQRLGDSVAVGINLNSMGDTYNRQKVFHRSVDVLLQARKIHADANDRAFLSQCLLYLSQAYLGLNKLMEAEATAANALHIAMTIGAKAQIRDITYVLVEISEKRGNTTAALAYMKKHLQFKDSVSNDETSKNIGKLEAKYDYDKALLQQEASYKIKQAVLEQNATRQRYFILIVVISLLFVTTIAFTIYFAYRRQRRSGEILQIKNLEINQQKNKIIEINKELKDQAQNLSDSNNTKDKLFSIIGHDLRSPINSLGGLLSLIEKKDITHDEFLLFSTELRANFEHVQFTLNNLLQWSMGQLNGIRTKPTNLLISDLVEENCNFLSGIAKAKGVTLVDNTHSEHCGYADRDQINLVIRNIVSNGIKFTNAGGVITFRSIIQNEELVVSIQDSGVGMAPDILKSLQKDKNSQTSAFGTSGEKGTGLGLMLSREMVARNGGMLSIESTVNIGTTVSFTVPVQQNSHK